VRELAEFIKIGVVKSSFTVPTDPGMMREKESLIIIDDEFNDGLYRVEENDYLIVVFHLHQSGDYRMQCTRYDGEVTGVFASRSPRRPTAIGVTTVRLLERNGSKLLVKGLDAIDGTPVLDIKPYNPALDEAEQERVLRAKEIEKPRIEIIQAIRRNDLEYLLQNAGSLHGHYCPGLAMGVIAGTYGMREFGLTNDGMENLLAVVETNNCFSDGIQYVSGCTFGNNSLVYRDFGKTAVAFSKRDGLGLRISARADYWGLLDAQFPEFAAVFQRVVKERQGGEQEKREFKKIAAKTSLALLDIPFDKLFIAEEAKVSLPAYAPIHPSVLCESCGESVMGTRVVAKNGKSYCINCADARHFELNGGGICINE
jgi:formylmethanofuran dehydrogenase subunit E